MDRLVVEFLDNSEDRSLHKTIEVFIDKFNLD